MKMLKEEFQQEKNTKISFCQSKIRKINQKLNELEDGNSMLDYEVCNFEEILHRLEKGANLTRPTEKLQNFLESWD